MTIFESSGGICLRFIKMEMAKNFRPGVGQKWLPPLCMSDACILCVKRNVLFECSGCLGLRFIKLSSDVSQPIQSDCLAVGKVSLKILIRDVDEPLLVFDIMRLWALHGFQHSEIRK